LRCRIGKRECVSVPTNCGNGRVAQAGVRSIIGIGLRARLTLRTVPLQLKRRRRAPGKAGRLPPRVPAGNPPGRSRRSRRRRQERKWPAEWAGRFPCFEQCDRPIAECYHETAQLPFHRDHGCSRIWICGGQIQHRCDDVFPDRSCCCVLMIGSRVLLSVPGTFDVSVS
jgi:hypothetical protein